MTGQGKNPWTFEAMNLSTVVIIPTIAFGMASVLV